MSSTVDVPPLQARPSDMIPPATFPPPTASGRAGGRRTCSRDPEFGHTPGREELETCCRSCARSTGRQTKGVIPDHRLLRANHGHVPLYKLGTPPKKKTTLSVGAGSNNHVLGLLSTERQNTARELVWTGRVCPLVHRSPRTDVEMRTIRITVLPIITLAY